MEEKEEDEGDLNKMEIQLGRDDDQVTLWTRIELRKFRRNSRIVHTIIRPERLLFKKLRVSLRAKRSEENYITVRQRTRAIKHVHIIKYPSTVQLFLGVSITFGSV